MSFFIFLEKIFIFILKTIIKSLFLSLLKNCWWKTVPEFL